MQHHGHTVVYVSLEGKDSERCGTISHPCQSIAMGIHQVDWGGHIYLDGTGTERKPYYCNSSMTHEQHLNINIQKTLSLISLKSTPHISCPSGFSFEKSGAQTTTIILSGVVFRQTPLMFQDSDLEIFNCSFQDTSTALRIHITDNTRRHLNIQDSFFINNNISCVEIILYHKDSKQDQLLALNISATTFMENGFHKQRFPRGAVTIRSQTTLPPNSVHVQISCLNVKSVNNVGYFMNLDLPSAVTNEVYDDVRLFNNTLSDLVKASTGRKTQNVVNSLYNSNTKKTRVKFSNVRCSHNHLLRCIKINSEEAQAEIHNSSFVAQRLQKERGGAIFFNSTAHGSVVIFNSKFRRNIAKGGGALFAHSKSGILTLNMTKVNFIECAAEMYGCAVLVGDLDSSKVENRSTHKFYANIREMSVRDCFNALQQCYFIRIVLSNGKVAITDSSWKNGISPAPKALMISNTGGKTDVFISGCTFVVNDDVRSAVRIRAQKAQAKGSILIENSAFSNQWVTAPDRGALWISPQFSMKLINVVLTSFAYALLILGLYPKGPSDTRPFHISISNCSFLENTFDMVAHSKDPARVELSIENTIFKSTQMTRKNVGLYFIVRPLGVLNSSSAVVKINNVTFDSRPCNVLSLLFIGNKTLRVQKSVFRNGICSQRYAWKGNVYETSAGAITVLTPPDKVVSTGCVKSATLRKETHPVWSYQTHALFEDNVFEGNLGLIAGAVYVSNGYTTFQRCTFRNNFATEHSGHVYSAYGTGRVDFKDCFFSTMKKKITINDITFHKTTFFHSESGGPTNLQNTTMMPSAAESYCYPVIDISNGGFVHIDDNSTIQCEIGNMLKLDNATHFVYTEQNKSFCRTNVIALKYSCALCGSGLYSMQKGVLRGVVANTIKCLRCPFGAICIAAKRNFWGYPVNTDPPSLRFILCPEHYCQKPSLDSKGYNSCQGNRSGTLCGSCIPGYSETLFSAECRKNAECSNYYFWISIIVLTTGLALYLIIKPPILVFLGNQILWFYRRKAHNQREDLNQNDDHRDRGYIKITFYFYQAAELLMLSSIENLLVKIPFIYIVIAVFNFQVRTINKGLGCPFVGLTAVTKELLLSGTVFLTMADIALVYVVHSFINILRRKEKPHLLQYLAVFMEVLLLGYERLAETSLKLMHCVSIGPRRWLFIDANVQCMQWWQYILLAYIVVFVVPFMIVLYCGSSKLYKASTSATEFLAACVLPLPFLIYWVYKEKRKRRGQESGCVPVVNRDVLEILHGPFRKPQGDDKGTLNWESVLIGRRFVLLACQAFISNLMLRMVCMVSACFLITIHHILNNPYRDPLANKAETLSLGALSMIAVINLAKATLMSSGTAIDGPVIPYLEVLDWFQVCALGFVPVLISILFTFAILSQLARLVVFLMKLIIRCWQKLRRTYCRSTAQERRLLLDIAEQNSGSNSEDWE